MEFEMDYGDPEKAMAVPDLPEDASLADIFFKFVTEDLITKMWQDYPSETWAKGSASSPSTMWKGVLNMEYVYISFAVYIRIMGIQNGPLENTTNDRPQRNNVTEALDHFKAASENYVLPGIECVEMLLSRFHIKYENFEQISRNFQRTMKDFGTLIAGDEKLLQFYDEKLRFYVKRSNFESIFGAWCGDVTKPGEWCGQINEYPDNFDSEPDGVRETEVAVYKWDRAQGNTKLTYKSTIFILGTKEPQALYRIRHVQGCCNTSGIDCAKVDIKDITSMAIDREGTTCLLRTNNAIKMGLPLGHTMGTTHKGRRGVVILTPEVSLLVDAEWLEETFKILNEASEKAKGAAGGSNTNSTSPVDPVEALEKLKVLLSKGLISQSEYDAKRGDVMERF
ncbi:hypothetical protein B484DRAFT_420297 [Ochromonadaceae sp. CCMP2298]|nr:hypothetical protein B484DRAFT_420297 [Ochromonadaceae sp. CCMP2298]